MFKLYLIAQNIRSLFNVGSMFRSSDVFAVDKIYLCGYTGFPPRKEISKTALGADTWIPWERQVNTLKLIRKLKSEGVKIVALETGANTTSIRTFKPQYPMALVVGNEKRGITPKLLAMADETISIPMFGKKESLNVGIAASIALYELTRFNKN